MHTDKPLNEDLIPKITGYVAMQLRERCLESDMDYPDDKPSGVKLPHQTFIPCPHPLPARKGDVVPVDGRACSLDFWKMAQISVPAEELTGVKLSPGTRMAIEEAARSLTLTIKNHKRVARRVVMRPMNEPLPSNVGEVTKTSSIICQQSGVCVRVSTDWTPRGTNGVHDVKFWIDILYGYLNGNG